MSSSMLDCRWFLSGFLVSVVYWMGYAHANEYNHHPLQNQAIHEQFYSTWKMPDDRRISCCQNRDCSPAMTYWKNGHWMARKVEEPDKNFVPIPDQKIEQERDTPDGRSHLCGSRAFPSGDFTVYCFIVGNGS